jgi:hypothetical protein
LRRREMILELLQTHSVVSQARRSVGRRRGQWDVGPCIRNSIIVTRTEGTQLLSAWDTIKELQIPGIAAFPPLFGSEEPPYARRFERRGAQDTSGGLMLRSTF